MQIYCALAILLVALILFVTEIIPLYVTAVGASIAMALFGIIRQDSFLSTFGQDSLLLYIGMSLVGGALIETGVSKKVSGFISRNFAKGEKSFLIIIMAFSAVISMFLSNVATTALMMPIIAIVSQTSNGKIDKRIVLMPMAIAVGIGGMSTLSGSPTQIIAQSIVTHAGYEPMGYFSLSAVGLPLLVFLMVFFVTIGYKISKKNLSSDVIYESKGDFPDAPDKKWNSKQIISILTLAGCLVCFITGKLSLGLVSIFGALIVICCGCFNGENPFAKIDWGTAFLVAGATSFASGLNNSGACEWIAKKILSLLGDNASHFTIFAVLCFIAVLLTNMATNTATCAMLTPIAIALAESSGMNVMSVVMGIVIGSSLSFSTPIAAPPMAMVVSEGNYRFIDYIKVGLLFNVLAYALTIILVPLIWPL